MTLAQAITSYRAEMRRRQFSANAQERYGRQLERFAEHVGEDTPLADITPATCRGYIDTFDNHAPSTVALVCTIISSFFKSMVLDDAVPTNPMDKVRRPKVPQARDRKRTRITSEQVETMLAACETWQERVCLNILAYLGVRRTALSNLRWRDIDGRKQTAMFLEKGGKRIEKPIPLQLRKVLSSYVIEEGPFHPDDWVVPNLIPMDNTKERQPRVVYGVVKRVAARCGIETHVHAFRAAFAVHFLRTNPAQIEALRQILGHSSISTTQGYLTELEGEAAMRVVESLTFTTGKKDAA